MLETVTVERSDITLTESVESVSILTHETVWYAKFEGPLSTGEPARLTRYSSTPAAAIASLEQAIRDQGWEIV